MKKLTNKSIFFLLVLFGLLLRLVFINAGLENFTVNGDEAMNFLLAKEIANGARPVLFWTQPYQFPIESYLISLVHGLLPWTTLGVRIIPIILCLLTLICFLYLANKLGKFKESWPAIVLILIPSAYSLTRQTLLFTPQHSITFLLCAVCPLLIWFNKNTKYIKTTCILAGLFAGLAVSNHLLVLSLVLMTSMAICFSTSLKVTINQTIYYFFGLVLGLLPYIYARLYIPGAYQKVADRRPIIEAIDQLWEPILAEIIPTALGINTLLYPDAGAKVTSFDYLVLPFVLLFILILLFLTVNRAVNFITRLKKDSWPSFELIDVFLGTTLLALAMMSVSDMTLYPRYSLLIVWYFPFLIYYCYQISNPKFKTIFTALIFLLIFINLVNSKQIYEFWTQKGFSYKYAFMPRLSRLYSHFKKNNITHCYAGWWISYQINVGSEEEIICSPPYNDRFVGWEQPYYRKLVDLEFNTPFVVGVYQHKWLKAENLMNSFDQHRLKTELTNLGKLKVINIVGHKDVTNSSILPLDKVVVRSNFNQTNLDNLIDSNLDTDWISTVNQKEDLSIELELQEKKQIHALRLFSTAKKLYERNA